MVSLLFPRVNGVSSPTWFMVRYCLVCCLPQRRTAAPRHASYISPTFPTLSNFTQPPYQQSRRRRRQPRPALYCNDSRTTRTMNEWRRGSENNNVNRTQYCTAWVGDLATHKDCKNSALKTHAKQHTMYFRFWSRKCDITPLAVCYHRHQRACCRACVYTINYNYRNQISSLSVTVLLLLLLIEHWSWLSVVVVGKCLRGRAYSIRNLSSG